jgi:simple sugar transport system substrate-binding protein
MKRLMLKLISGLAISALALAACTPAAPPEPTAAPTEAAKPLKIGLVMVGPKEDHGWNEAHWEGVQYVLKNAPGTELEWIDKVNPADRPGVTIEQVADDFAAKGVRLIITNSAEFKDPTNNAARAHPDITFIHASGDAVLDGTAPANVGNIMGRMEYGKMIAGCAAGLTTETGSISYLGPLIDPETRRLVNSTYLGAKYCWENYRGKSAADLKFTVTWIGFWFNIPGVTLDPTQVANDFFNNGSDVVLSGIDTTEGLVVTGQRAKAGEKVWAIPYDYLGGCAEATDVCLGVPYFNWGPAYLAAAKAVQAGTWKSSWDWNGPDWKDINDPDTSAVGWVDGKALSAENAATLKKFIAGLADGSINLWQGPLKYQDGTDFVASGGVADDKKIWYTQQLLEGVTGPSQ